MRSKVVWEENEESDCTREENKGPDCIREENKETKEPSCMKE